LWRAVCTAELSAHDARQGAPNTNLKSRLDVDSNLFFTFTIYIVESAPGSADETFKLFEIDLSKYAL
jgi:hypothetical protein